MNELIEKYPWISQEKVQELWGKYQYAPSTVSFTQFYESLAGIYKPDSPEEKCNLCHSCHTGEECHDKPETTHEKDIVNPQKDDCKPDFIEEALSEFGKLLNPMSGELDYEDARDFLKEKLTEAVKHGEDRADWMGESLEGARMSGRLAMKEEVLNLIEGYFKGLLMVPFPQATKVSIMAAIREMK